jgi:hypothetical protein
MSTQMKYAKLDLGTIEAVINKLGGMEGVERFLRDELVVKMPERVWKTWMTIKLGTLKNVEEIRQALKADGNNIGDWANDILGKPAFTVSVDEQDVELVNVSVEELGFKQGACYADICKRAFELGLDLCPAEVGPQLRLQYKDQPKGTYVVVAMNAITGSGGGLIVFGVERYDVGGRYLYASYGYAGHVWRANFRFVFLRRKSTQN